MQYCEQKGYPQPRSPAFNLPPPPPTPSLSVIQRQENKGMTLLFIPRSFRHPPTPTPPHPTPHPPTSPPTESHSSLSTHPHILGQPDTHVKSPLPPPPKVSITCGKSLGAARCPHIQRVWPRIVASLKQLSAIENVEGKTSGNNSLPWCCR